jgi:Mg-chelatase subunit ChlD
MKSLVTSAIALSVLGAGFLLTQGCSGSGKGSGFAGPTNDDADASADGGTKGTVFGSSDAAVDVVNDPLKGCATNTQPVTRLPVYLLFLADRSGSMSGTKWSSVQGAMKSVFQSIHDAADTNEGAGLILFPADGSETGPYPGTKDVFVNYVNDGQLAALNKRISDSTTGSTPTWEAMNGAYGELQNLVVAAPLPKDGKKVLVLMTDGQPNDSAKDYVGLVKNMIGLSDSIQTYVVGIGDVSGGYDVDPTFLGPLAVAGGTARPACDPTEDTVINKMCHYQVEPGSKSVAQLTTDFINAFNHIRASASACELSLATDTSNADPTKINVVIDNGMGKTTLVKQDATNGWTYDDPAHPTKVILHGQSCQDAVENITGQVEVVLGCKTQTN